MHRGRCALTPIVGGKCDRNTKRLGNPRHPSHLRRQQSHNRKGRHEVCRICNRLAQRTMRRVAFGRLSALVSFQITHSPHGRCGAFRVSGNMNMGLSDVALKQQGDGRHKRDHKPILRPIFGAGFARVQARHHPLRRSGSNRCRGRHSSLFAFANNPRTALHGGRRRGAPSRGHGLSRRKSFEVALNGWPDRSVARRAGEWLASGRRGNSRIRRPGGPRGWRPYSPMPPFLLAVASVNASAASRGDSNVRTAKAETARSVPGLQSFPCNPATRLRARTLDVLSPRPAQSCRSQGADGELRPARYASFDNLIYIAAAVWAIVCGRLPVGGGGHLCISIG